MSDKAAGQKARSLEGCDENGPAAALLLSHVSIQICSFLSPVRLGPPCRRPILIATPLPQSLTWCTREHFYSAHRYRIRNFLPPIFESVRTPARIIPHPSGRLFWGGAGPGTSCQATIMLSPLGRNTFRAEGLIELALMVFSLGLPKKTGST